MNFVWINPVTAQLYPNDHLANILIEKGFTPVECIENMMAVVKEKYRRVIAESPHCVMDMRCPKAADFMQNNLHLKVKYPSIHPILIHCAISLAAEYAKSDNCLYITTPCTSLCNYGNGLALANTRFYTWKEFADKADLHLECQALPTSPIPPGFFKEYGADALSLCSREKMGTFVAQGESLQGIKIVELLYCEQGCHNGDGIPGRKLHEKTP